MRPTTNEWDTLPTTLSVRDICRVLQIGEVTARKLMQTGAIPGAVKIGRSWRVDKATIRRFCEGGYAS